MAFDENQKHSFEKCELVRILSTTITRSNTEFAKLSFENIYNPIAYITECYNHLWKEWANDKISSNDILKDSTRWDEWMVNYYTNCKQDYFNSIGEMFVLMQFHTQSLQGDFSWVFKQENLAKISSHDGMVSTKLVNKLDYLLKKHNFGTLNLQPKDQKYRTRKRGGCKMCNQIRDVKRMLEKQIANDNDTYNDNTNFSENGSNTSSKKKRNKSKRNKKQQNIGCRTGLIVSSMARAGAGAVTQPLQQQQQGWITTEVISNNGMGLHNYGTEISHLNFSTLTSGSSFLNHSSSNDGQSDTNSNSAVLSLLGSETDSGLSMESGKQIATGGRGGGGSRGPLMTMMNGSHRSSDSELYHLKSPESSANTIDSVVSDEFDGLLLLTPTPPPPGIIINLDDLLSSVGLLNTAEIMNERSFFPASPLQTGKIDTNLSDNEAASLHSGESEKQSNISNKKANTVAASKAIQSKMKTTLRATAAEFKLDSNYCTSNSSISISINSSLNEVKSQWYDINRLFSNVGCFSIIANGQDAMNMPDPCLKQFRFNAISIKSCPYATIVEFMKPTVLVDSDCESYFYYIPREYLCNIKSVTQFKLAIENLSNWDKSLYASESAWYTHENFVFDYPHSGSFFGPRNSYPDWLNAIEVKVLEMLTKFPELSALMKENVPNSCMMNNFDNGNKNMSLRNENGKYFQTQSGSFASMTLSLGATRTLAVGSMMDDHVFGINLKYGDICIMAGKFESCYKYGIPTQSGINGNTLCLKFGKIDNGFRM